MKYVAGLVVLLVVSGSLVFWSQWRRPRQTVSGFVEAHDIRVGSRVGGRIDKVDVEEGDFVTAGQVLVEFAPFDLYERHAEAAATLAAKQADLDRLKQGFRTEEIAQAKAHRDQLEARLTMLKAGPRAQEKDIARFQVETARATLELAQQKYKRTKEVFDKGQGSGDEMDAATQQRRNAQAQLQVREQELSLANEGTRLEEIAEAQAKLAEARAAFELAANGYRKEEIAAADASVKAAAAALATIQQQIDELKIKAPLAGVIDAMDLRKGDLVPPNAPVLSLMDTSILWVRAYVPETTKLAVRQIVPVTLDAFPGQKFDGEVAFISSEAEFTPRNVQTLEERSKQVFRIKVKIPAGFEKKIRPGMIADVWLEQAK